MQIDKGKATYTPNSIGGGCPFLSKAVNGGFTSYEEKIDSTKIRSRSKSFMDHFSQAILFYDSQTAPEKQHIKDALSFELSKVLTPAIKQRMVNDLTNINMELAVYVAQKTGITKPAKRIDWQNGAVPADADPAYYAPVLKKPAIAVSKALSMAVKTPGSIDTRQVAVLIAQGVDEISLDKITRELQEKGAGVQLIAPDLSVVKSVKGKTFTPNHSLFNTASVLFDAVYIPGGKKSIQFLCAEPDAIHFVNEAYRHCKAIGADKDAELFIQLTNIHISTDKKNEPGIILDGNTPSFINAIAVHRFWERENERKVPA